MITFKDINKGDVVEIEYEGVLRKLEVMKYLVSQHDDIKKLGCYILEEKKFIEINKLNIIRIIYKGEYYDQKR